MTAKLLDDTTGHVQPFSTISLAARTSEVARMRAWLERVGAEWALDAGVLFKLELCTDELVANVIMHGQAGDDPTAIRLRLDVQSDAVVLTVEDDGHPFDPTAAAAPKKCVSLEDAPIGGLGLHLVRQMSSSMHYQRLGDTNRLTVHFPTAAG